MAGLLVIILSMGFLYSFRSEVAGSLGAALLGRNSVKWESIQHDGVTPGPTIKPKPKPKPRQIFPAVVQVSQPSSYLSGFPVCFREVGQYYGQNGERGTDFDCGYRTQVPALWGGTVVGAYRTCWDSACISSSGGVVIVRAVVAGIGEHDTYYLHLDAVAVSLGEVVQKGQLLGWTGGCIGYGHWITSPWFTSGCHIEIGYDAPFLPHYSFNSNPLPWIDQALS